MRTVVILTRPGGRPASERRGSPGPLSLGPRPFYVGLAGPLLPRLHARCVGSACHLQAAARAARPFLGVLRALYPRVPQQEPPGPNFTLCEWPGLPKQVTTNGWASHYRDGLSPSSGGQHLTSECGQGLPLRPQGGSRLPPPAPRAPVPVVPPVSASVITWPLGVPVCFLYHLF